MSFVIAVTEMKVHLMQDMSDYIFSETSERLSEASSGTDLPNVQRYVLMVVVVAAAVAVAATVAAATAVVVVVATPTTTYG